MSKIRDALVRAKKERVGSEPFSPPDRPGSGPDGAPQTKVVNYSEAAVIKHKVITPYFEDRELSERFKLLMIRILTLFLLAASQLSSESLTSINLMPAK